MRTAVGPAAAALLGVSVSQGAWAQAYPASGPGFNPRRRLRSRMHYNCRYSFSRAGYCLGLNRILVIA